VLTSRVCEGEGIGDRTCLLLNSPGEQIALDSKLTCIKPYENTHRYVQTSDYRAPLRSVAPKGDLCIRCTMVLWEKDPALPQVGHQREFTDEGWPLACSCVRTHR
jgi:hypothetical protein